MSKKQRPKSIWRNVHLLLCFYKDRKGKTRSGAKTWAPKDATAGIHRDPDQQELVAVIEPQKGSGEREVTIRFRQDEFAIRRDEGKAWSGVLIQDDQIHVRVNGRDIAIDAQGQVKEYLLPDRDAG